MAPGLAAVLSSSDFREVRPGCSYSARALDKPQDPCGKRVEGVGQAGARREPAPLPGSLPGLAGSVAPGALEEAVAGGPGPGLPCPP